MAELLHCFVELMIPSLLVLLVLLALLSIIKVMFGA